MAGRPPFFSSPEELEQKIQEYFEYCEGRAIPPEDPDDEPTVTKGHPVTITGLALWLGFESRQSFYDYEKHEQYSYIIKKARLTVECEYEKSLQGKNPTGSIFALKNMGWKDKHEVEQSGGLTIKFEDPGSYVYPSQDQSDSGIPESL